MLWKFVIVRGDHVAAFIEKSDHHSNKSNPSQIEPKCIGRNNPFLCLAFVFHETEGQAQLS
jgi:hypothetical protein